MIEWKVGNDGWDDGIDDGDRIELQIGTFEAGWRAYLEQTYGDSGQ